MLEKLNKTTLLYNWGLIKDDSIHGSVTCKLGNYSIYYLYHSSIFQLECFICVEPIDELDITPGSMLFPGEYIDYISFENIY